MEVQKPWRKKIHAWCESIWTEPFLPLCAAVPSHFKVHTSLFPARLFLYETESVPDDLSRFKPDCVLVFILKLNQEIQ